MEVSIQREPLLEADADAPAEVRTRLCHDVRRGSMRVVVPLLIFLQAGLLAVPITGCSAISQLVAHVRVGDAVEIDKIQTGETLTAQAKSMWQIGAKPLGVLMLGAGVVQPATRFAALAACYFLKMSDAARSTMILRQEVLGKTALSGFFIQMYSVDLLGFEARAPPGGAAAAEVVVRIGGVLLAAFLCSVVGNMVSLWSITCLRLEAEAAREGRGVEKRTAEKRAHRGRKLARRVRLIVSGASVVAFGGLYAVALSSPVARVHYDGFLAEFLVDQPKFGVYGVERASPVTVVDVFRNLVTKVARDNSSYLAWWLAALCFLAMGVGAPLAAFALSHAAFLATDPHRASRRRREARMAFAWSSIEPMTLACLAFTPALRYIAEDKFDAKFGLDACGPARAGIDEPCLLMHAAYGPGIAAFATLWALLLGTVILLPRLGGAPYPAA